MNDINWIKIYEQVSVFAQHAADTGSNVGYLIVSICFATGIVLFFTIKQTKVPSVIAWITAASLGAFFFSSNSKLNNRPPYVLKGTLYQKYEIRSGEKTVENAASVSHQLILDVEKAYNLSGKGLGQEIPDLIGKQDFGASTFIYANAEAGQEIILICLPHDNKAYFYLKDGQAISSETAK